MGLIAAVLAVFSLAASIAVPLVAAYLVLRQHKPRRAPVANWFGLAIAGELAVALSLYALSAVATAAVTWKAYYAGTFVAVATALLGHAGARVHLRRLVGLEEPAPKLAAAYLGLAAFVAVALAPWVLGAPLPPGAGGFVTGTVFAGTAVSYASFVVPVVLALDAGALLLGCARWKAASATGGTLAVIITAVTLLPRSTWDSRYVARQEFAAARAEASAVDAPRRQAILAVASGRGPDALPMSAPPGFVPCPPEYISTEWRDWARLAGPIRDWQTIATLDATWSGQHSVNVWHSAMGGVRGIRERGRPGAPKSIDEIFAGPWRTFVDADLADNKTWLTPWPEHDVFVSADEARRRVHRRPPAVDATFVIMRETLSYSIANEITLASINGSVWVWSYDRQAIVCAGEVSTGPASMVGEFHDAQAPIVKNALRMRAAARALGALYAVGPIKADAGTGNAASAAQQ